MPTYFEGDIVIAGISGRLPESSNIEEFKENLMNGTDMVTEDDRRWKPGLYGLPSRFGKLKDLHSFDASFFKISPKQAHIMDPQMRIMLEVTFEALIDAGINPSTLKKSHTGVFIGVYTSDANDFWKRKPESHEWFRSSKGMIANRISYTFDLIGPSFLVDTLCSSSLTAMHQAILAIRSGECDAAIVGGLNLVLDPVNSLHYHHMNILSTDGKCKSFDISADGYVRSEAVVAIYLQKMTDARRVYATVMNTAINMDGYKPEGIMHPSGDMQYMMLQKMYNEVNIDPKNVVYVEAHGTGTKAGDLGELDAIDKLFCKDRKTPLLIGSVKSNMGHAEAASGLSGIAKVLIAMETGVIPANLHFAVPNPNICALTEGRIRVIDKATPWNGGLVGISSFGIGGTNSHVILRSNSKVKVSLDHAVETRLPKLVAVSGRTKEAVQIILNKANEHQQNNEFLSLLYSLHSDNISEHNIRGYEILAYDSTREIVEANYDEKRPVWFIFSGINSQWPGMGRELLHIETCQRSLQRCADVLKEHDVDLMNIIINGTDETYENVLVATVSIVAIQIALIDMLIFMDVRPDGIIGHSLGEISCSYADGAFTLEQTILAAYYRGKSIIESDLEPGAMAVVNLNWEKVKKMSLTDITPACHNSADLVTISGSPTSVKKFVEELKSKNIFAKMINCCGVAYHSKYIVPVKSKFRASLDMIVPKPKQRSTRWISSSVPEAAWDSPLAQFCSPDYHVNNMLSPVLFQEAIAHIPKNAITIEIAPHCLLQTILRKSLPSTVINIGLQKLNHSNNLIFLLSNVGKMYIGGAQPDIAKLYPSVSFPVSRGTPMIGSLVKWDHSATWQIPDFKHKSKESSEEHVIEINLSSKTDAYLTGHKIDGRFVYPGGSYILMVWQLFAKLHDTHFEQLPVVFENIWLQRITFLPENKTIKFLIKLIEETGDFVILEANTIVASGNIRIAEIIEKNQLNLPSLPMPSTKLLLNTEDMYRELRLRGYEHSGIFKGLKCCDISFTVGELHWFNEWSSYIDNMFQFKLLSNDRKLVYGSKCRYTMINPILHKRMVNELPKNGGLPIYHYKNVNIVISGGIEIRDMKCTAPQRLQKTTKPKYERYVFVPYENSSSLVLKDPKTEKIHILTVLLQTVCENITTSRIKAVEIADNRAAERLLAPLVHDILSCEPLVTVDLQVAVSSASDYTISFNQTDININVIKWDVNDTFPAQNMHLIIAAEVLSGRSCFVLKNLAATLSSNCFILLEETGIFDLTIALKEAHLMLIGKQIDSSGKSYFLLRKRKVRKEPILIEITENDFSWLANAKAALSKFDSENQDVLFVSQSEELLGLIGFVHCIRREVANVRYIYIQDSNAPKFDLFSQFYAKQLEKELMANVFKGGQWGSYRHLQLDQHIYVELEHAYVDTLTTGNLNSLEWIQSPLTYCQTKYPNTLCSVYYASLNFRDILLATGKLSMDALSSLGLVTEDYVLGLEFSGRDANGCRVMGLTKSRGLTTTVLPDSDFLWKVPEEWTLEQAATIPFAYVISYYALFVRGRLKAGKNVLIHSGAGAVGLAAINIALHAGCTVFATVGTEEKRLYLKKTFSQLTDKHIGNSRDTSFEQLILDETQGCGVDVVLNSLSEKKLHASVRCLAKNGRFLDIGKYDMLNGNRIDMSIFLKNISYHGILLEMLFEDSEDKLETVRLISEGIENGVVRPLPTTVFSKQSLEEGFRFMMAGKHIGKVLLKIRDEEPQKHMLSMQTTVAAIPRTYMYPDKSYVLIGGLGGFGLELANWMITRGARFIVLVSRTGIRTGYQMSRVQHWRNNGIKVIISTADITTFSGAECLIDESNRLAPVGGIFNLAVVLRDALFENLQVVDFETVILPKVNGTRNLDVVSRKSCPSLDLFVVFSTIASSRGNASQSNYGLANSAIEKIIEQRHTAGLPGLAIQWGVIGDVGLYIDSMKDKNIGITRIGVLPQRVSSCLETIDVFLQQPYPVVSSTVIAEKRKSVNNDDSIDHVVHVIANILGIENISVNINDSFDKFGIDSLSYMEIRQILEREYGILLSLREMYVLTLSKLLDLLAKNDVSHNPSTS
ncbi:fatty acid synthase-like [Camponotus floridanus]|uniref:fatty acid synthase-like n=1 Tax=Camponotus floridanus TaxID=104421 RepID=UPI000DC6C5F6|nr:fatty acid synthase-like [Camponotus floridanus]